MQEATPTIETSGHTHNTKKGSSSHLVKLFGAAATAIVLSSGCAPLSSYRQDAQVSSVSLSGEIGQLEEYIKQLKQDLRLANKENKIFLAGEIKRQERILQLKKQELGRINQDLNRMNQRRNTYYYY